VLVARGRVYLSNQSGPGRIHVIDPSQPPGVVATLSNTLGDAPVDITTDGQFIWTANLSSVSRVNPANGTSLTFTAGFATPIGILFDGTNLWVTDYLSNSSNPGMLHKLGSSGAVVQNVIVGAGPSNPIFDGSNIWVPNFVGQSVSVVRARDGMVLATLTGNGLNGPVQAAFDGQRVLVTNFGTDFHGNSVSMWNAADLTPIGSFDTGAATAPASACSDGINFWITLNGTGQLARF
jgi:DNA-binding beta-propeller fold protein YncE